MEPIDFQTQTNYARLPTCSASPISFLPCRNLPKNSLLYRYGAIGSGFADPAYPLWLSDLKNVESAIIQISSSLAYQFKIEEDLRLLDLSLVSLALLLAALHDNTLPLNKTDKDFLRDYIRYIEVDLKSDTATAVRDFCSRHPNLGRIYEAYLLQNIDAIQKILKPIRKNSKETTLYIPYTKDASTEFNENLYRNQKFAEIVQKMGFDGWVITPFRNMELLDDTFHPSMPEVLISNPNNKVSARLFRKINIDRAKNLGGQPPNYSLKYVTNLRKRRGSTFLRNKSHKVRKGNIYSQAEYGSKKNKKSNNEVNMRETQFYVGFRKRMEKPGKFSPENFGISPNSEEYLPLLGLLQRQNKLGAPSKERENGPFTLITSGSSSSSSSSYAAPADAGSGVLSHPLLEEQDYQYSPRSVWVNTAPMNWERFMASNPVNVPNVKKGNTEIKLYNVTRKNTLGGMRRNKRKY